jgi:hypothetical protein
MNYRKKLYIDGRTKVTGKEAKIQKWDNPIDLNEWLNFQLTQLTLLPPSPAGDTDWTQDANGVWNDTDNIGIGTNAPSTIFDVVDERGDITSTFSMLNGFNFGPDLRLEDSSNGNSMIQFFGYDGSAERWRVEIVDGATFEAQDFAMDQTETRFSRNDATGNVDTFRMTLNSILTNSAGFFGTGSTTVTPSSTKVSSDNNVGTLSELEVSGTNGTSALKATSPFNGITMTLDSSLNLIPHGVILIIDDSGSLTEYADNADALANGLIAGCLYRTGDLLKIVH